MLLCDRAAIIDLLHEAYVAASEEQNPGLVERTIAAVSGEVADALSYRYPQPWPSVPDLVRYIAAVLSAYRVVKAMTGLVNTESGSDNDWIPLQQQWKRCTALLEDFASGKQKLPLPEANPDREEASVAVASPGPFFDFRGF